MHRNLRSCLLSAFCLMALPAALSAEEALSANDLEAAQVTSAVTIDGFTILATPEKGVTIEPMGEIRTAPDGEVFNNRIKLNGGGGVAYRALKFTVKDDTEVGVYLNSSSGTDARVLKVTDADGTVVFELAAPADDKANAGYVTVKLAKAGEYLVFSAASGINIYRIVIGK